MMPVDPRAWNLVAGLCLVSGCGSRTISMDGDGDVDGDGGTDETQSEGTESSTSVDTDDPGCVSASDCPPGYDCYNGMCEYVPPDDGHHESNAYDCTSDSDCSSLELCEFDYCLPLASPLVCPAPDPAPVLVIPVAALALQFADIDSDGAQELVVATASELQVYENGSDVPVLSPRGLDSDSIDAMVGGSFDATAGDDVVILFADELRLHRSDGAGNFSAPSMTPSAWPDSVGLLAGEFDGADPADVLIWAGSGAGVELGFGLGNGDVIALSSDVIGSATARSLADPLGGFVLRRDAILEFYSAAGEPIAGSTMRGVSPYALTSIAQLGDGFDLSASGMARGQWTIIEQWGPGTGNLGTHWGLLGRVTLIAGGDFDGDARADIALLIDGTVQIQFGVLTDTSCLAMYPFAALAVDLATGDHDGDGDDEIAVRFEAGHIAVLDGE